MLKLQPTRNLRSRGFKVKHFLQICLLLAICFWLLNQLKNSYNAKKEYEDSTGNISEMEQNGHENIKLGRKGLHPRVDEATSLAESQGDKAEFEEEIEEIKPEDVEDDGRGGGDDEIDGHDQDRAEEEESDEVEDLIDVDDRERDVGGEEQESEEKSNRVEEVSSVNDQTQNKGVRNSLEEHYKGDDASSSVQHNTRTLSTEIGDNGEIDSANEKPQVMFNSRLMLMDKSHLLNEKDTLPEKIPNSKGTAIGKHRFLQAVSRQQYRSSNEAIKSRQPNINSTISTMSPNLDAVDSGIATVSKSMVTEQIMKLGAAALSEGKITFAAINENNYTANSKGSESVANVIAETAVN